MHQIVPIHALIDISDGLSSDLGHILTESGGLGAVLDESAIPIHPDAHEMSQRDGTPALDHALNDGEDFELCLVVSADDAARLLAAPPAPAKLYRVGTVTELPGLRLRGPDRPGETDRARWASIISAQSKIRHEREKNRQHADVDLIRKRDRAVGPRHRRAGRAGRRHRAGRPARCWQDPAGACHRRSAGGRSRRRSRARRSS